MQLTNIWNDSKKNKMYIFLSPQMQLQNPGVLAFFYLAKNITVSFIVPVFFKILSQAPKITEAMPMSWSSRLCA